MSLLFIAWEVVTKQLGERKQSHVNQKEVKVSLFEDDMLFYIECHEDSTKKPLELIRNSVKLQDTKSAYKNPIFSVYRQLINPQSTLRKQQKVKYLEIILSKEVKDIYTEN